MKRTVIMLSMLLAGMGNAMQAKDVKGTVVYRSDGQPVVGAEVRVKGTKEKSGDLFGGDGTAYKKVEAGMQLGVGAVIRHLYFGVNLQLGLTPLLEASGPDESSPNVKNFSADLSVGYCF